MAKIEIRQTAGTEQAERIGQLQKRQPVRYASPAPEATEGTTCPLCLLSAQARVAGRGSKRRLAGQCWELWDGSERSARTIRDILHRSQQRTPAALGSLDPAEIIRHFRYHNAEQPAPPRSLRSEQLIDLSTLLSPEQIGALFAVWRARVLTTPQLIDLCFPHATTLADGPDGHFDDLVDDATSVAIERAPYLQAQRRQYPERLLRDLARRNILYRAYTPRSSGRGQKPTVWFLARHGAGIIGALTGEKPARYTWVETLADVAPRTIPHDIEANQLLLELQRACSTRKMTSKNSRIALSFNPENWLGPRQLSLSFYDRFAHRQRNIIPDALCTVGLHLERGEFFAGSRAREGLMPLFIEYDRGSRNLPDVVEQLLAYQALGSSSALAARFPDLAHLPDYTPPVVMAFRRPERVELVARRLREALLRRGIRGDRQPPILLVSAEDWLRDPILGGSVLYIGDSKHDRRHPLLPLLMQLSRGLIEQQRLRAETVLQIDRAAARTLHGGAQTGTYSEDADEE